MCWENLTPTSKRRHRQSPLIAYAQLALASGLSTMIRTRRSHILRTHFPLHVIVEIQLHGTEANTPVERTSLTAEVAVRTGVRTLEDSCSVG